MAQTQGTTSTNSSTDGTDKRSAKVVTPIDAVTKISKILNQLAPGDRKRVLAFLSESNDIDVR